MRVKRRGGGVVLSWQGLNVHIKFFPCIERARLTHPHIPSLPTLPPHQNMPELHWTYGYLFWWLTVAFVIGCLMILFRMYRLIPGSSGSFLRS